METTLIPPNECQICFRKFKTPASLYRHLFLFHSIHPDIADDWAYGYRDDNSTLRTAKEQERRTLTLQEAVDHAKRIGSYQCKLCGSTITDLVSLTAMVRDGRGYCPTCMDITDHPNKTIEERLK